MQKICKCVRECVCVSVYKCVCARVRETERSKASKVSHIFHSVEYGVRSRVPPKWYVQHGGNGEGQTVTIVSKPYVYHTPRPPLDPKQNPPSATPLTSPKKTNHTKTISVKTN